MSAPYDSATEWRAPKRNTPENAPRPCVICGADTDQLADCTLDADAAWFLFICVDCYAAKTAAETPA